MKRIFSLALLLTISVSAWSQSFSNDYLTDALRFSDYRLTGTARAAAMGNAFGALGGDFTSASINPAGIGFYRSNEFVITLKYKGSNIDGTYPYNTGATTSESKSKMSVPNFGYVATFNTMNSGSSLISINLGLGYNRMNDFNMRKRAIRADATSSFLDVFAKNANLIGNSDNFDSFYEALAYKTFMLNLYEFTDEDGNIVKYFNNPINEFGYGQTQRYSLLHEGSIEEYLFSLAANINHKFYFGLTLGIHDVFSRETTLMHEFETDPNEQTRNPEYDWYTFSIFRKITGTGFNTKLGAIYRPIDQLRLGVALHTPTWYNLTELYDTRMDSYALGYDEKTDEFYWGEFWERPASISRVKYDLQTPLRVVFSAAGVIGKSGLISIDYEMVDYSKAKLGDSELDMLNDNIKQEYRSVGNLHIGGEYRITSPLSLRAGFEYFPSPYKSGTLNEDAHTYTYSAGLGWRYKNFFADLAYKHSVHKDYLMLYPIPEYVEDNTTAKFENKLDNIMLTFGFRF